MCSKTYEVQFSVCNFSQIDSMNLCKGHWAESVGQFACHEPDRMLTEPETFNNSCTMGCRVTIREKGPKLTQG